MSRIRVMMADDHAEICGYFEGIVSREPDMEWVGSVRSGAAAVKTALEVKPDIVLMDIQMETRTAGITASRQILAALPQTKVIILTILEDDDLLFQAYCAGAIDYIIKTDAAGRIVASIRNAYSNQLILRPEYAEKIIDELKRVREEQHSLLYSLNTLSRLSNSEFEVLKSLYQGLSARQIAEERYVSLGTVKSQIHSILQKFGLKSVREVVRKLHEINFEYIVDAMPRG